MPENLVGRNVLKNLLDELPRRVARRGARMAVTAAANPILKGARARAPRASGLLKKAIGKKVKAFGSTAVAIIGARKDVQGSVPLKSNGATTKFVFRKPSRYFHLVEKGTRQGAKANPFLADAYAANKGSAELIAAAKMSTFVESEAFKLGKR
jgi:HK97 gp10 family phage protein